MESAFYFVGEFCVYFIFSSFQFIPERKPYQMGTSYISKLASITTTSFSYTWLLNDAYSPMDRQEKAEDKWLLICCLSPFLILHSLCWWRLSSCPGHNATVFSWISQTRMCRQCCIAAVSKLLALLSPTGNEHINPLTYFAFAGLAAWVGVLSVGITTAQDLLNNQRIIVWELTQASYPLASGKTR